MSLRYWYSGGRIPRHLGFVQSLSVSGLRCYRWTRMLSKEEVRNSLGSQSLRKNSVALRENRGKKPGSYRWPWEMSGRLEMSIHGLANESFFQDLLMKANLDLISSRRKTWGMIVLTKKTLEKVSNLRFVSENAHWMSVSTQNWHFPAIPPPPHLSYNGCYMLSKELGDPLDCCFSLITPIIVWGSAKTLKHFMGRPRFDTWYLSKIASIICISNSLPKCEVWCFTQATFKTSASSVTNSANCCIISPPFPSANLLSNSRSVSHCTACFM